MRHLLLAMLLFPLLTLHGQVVDLPLSHEAYEFMDRMEAKGYLPGYKDAIRPMPRSSFARNLFNLRLSRPVMTRYEEEQYEFLLQEFREELQRLYPDSVAVSDRWRLAAFDIIDGRMFFEPIVSIETRRDGDRSMDKRVTGFQLSGHAFGKLGYYFNYAGTNEKGKLVNVKKVHTPEQGVPYFGAVSGLEYNSNQSILSYDFDRFDLSIEQTMNAWGNERFGNLTLSSKPPSFPKIKFRSALSDWMNFTYIFAELHSNVFDSLHSYDAGTSTLKRLVRTVYRSKYFATHMFEVTAWGLFDLTFGESVVYSDRGPSLLYLIPIAFFKSGEHYNRDTDNTQIFIGFDAPLQNGITVTGSLFVDEIMVSVIGDAAQNRNQLGFSLGTRFFDIPLENLEISAEYTRINPWVYSHKYAAATYTNNGFTMGHWIEQNADLASLEFTYRPFRALNAGLLYQIYRKGDTSDVYNQYDMRAEKFLYGRQRIEQALTLSVSYQAVRDGFIEAYYRFGTVEDHQRTVPARYGIHEAMIRLRYGIW